MVSRNDQGFFHGFPEGAWNMMKIYSGFYLRHWPNNHFGDNRARKLCTQMGVRINPPATNARSHIRPFSPFQSVYNILDYLIIDIYWYTNRVVPSVISWFINPINYRYTYHKPYLLELYTKQANYGAPPCSMYFEVYFRTFSTGPSLGLQPFSHGRTSRLCMIHIRQNPWNKNPLKQTSLQYPAISFGFDVYSISECTCIHVYIYMYIYKYIYLHLYI